MKVVIEWKWRERPRSCQLSYGLWPVVKVSVFPVVVGYIGSPGQKPTQ
ncbi:MAG: hypothetical protein AVDCRST_MAG95-308 [uncultured Adhaeribacter sp.]|uniref:Uncharacterized protein n=1 Tax=uncultured Adhaeribacter sp. TaxID=448109 RepID=A0A6J4H5R0_9BACT|nr:MAG: hypothetical protein AVDCRST_MAG95-308 [uncultured Adhaeribacter sp.]